MLFWQFLNIRPEQHIFVSVAQRNWIANQSAQEKGELDQHMAKCCRPLPQCKASGLQVLSGETPVVRLLAGKKYIFQGKMFYF